MGTINVTMPVMPILIAEFIWGSAARPESKTGQTASIQSRTHP